MNIIMLGAPGAGKGTQAAVLCEHFGIPTISTGNMIREALKNGTEMGLKAKSYMDEGKLVPDEVVIGIVKERLSADDCKKGFILDGFPRTIPQAEALDNMGVEIQHVINIDISDEKIINRMSGRRACLNCGATYHIVYNPSKKEGICDTCGQQLVLRDDDKPETVKKRLSVYHDQTQPLIDYYKNEGILAEVDGTKDMEEVFQDIVNILGA